jgi:tagaturonate reductase
LELLEHNGTRLRDLVVEQVARWSRVPGDPHGWRQIQTDFGAWLHHANRWLTTLVDRMVVRLPESAEASAADPAGVLTEPYWLLAVQDDGGPREILPQRQSRLNEPVVNWVPDLSIYYLRKVRILNGLHTAMVAMAGERGWGATVAEVLSNAAAREWLQELLQEEILPVLRPRVPDVDAYAAAIWRRLENPAFQHRLADIALNHSAKLAVRLQPTLLEFQSLFGRTPPRLAALCSRSAESECAR